MGESHRVVGFACVGNGVLRDGACGWCVEGSLAQTYWSCFLFSGSKAGKMTKAAAGDVGGVVVVVLMQTGRDSVQTRTVLSFEFQLKLKLMMLVFALRRTLGTWPLLFE